RIGDKPRSVIPLSQAAYTKGRSVTEHVFALRTLAEKAITSSEYKLTLLMLDMSSAFDRAASWEQEKTSDISNRKHLSLAAFSKISGILQNKKITTKLKVRVFNVYVTSICLYNSELWTITKLLENEIDVFQRKFLRRILGIKWLEKIRNDELYRKTGEEEWSKKVKKRILIWYGHLLRLDEHTPARMAYHEAERK
ncbi:uncharacterized protein LOC117120996, partial [Anneissia japonica]|uniref:uncharacterized protein LOC117120996 n=1 Tax=Anneissia japonica TaxID=1529436 RepID=UPI0014257162